MTPKKKSIPLREVYLVRFEIPSQPGHWTDTIGRFETRAAAEQWAGQLAYKSTVVLELLMPGEATGYSRGATLTKYRKMIEEAFA